MHEPRTHDPTPGAAGVTPEELNLDEVDALLASLDAGGGGTNERRRHARSPAAGHVPVVVRRSGSAPVRASLRDLSRSGAGLYSPVPAEPGERVEVELDLRGRQIRATCRVVSCRCGADGQQAVGLEFLAIVRGDGQGTTPARPAPTTGLGRGATGIDHPPRSRPA